MTSTLSWLFRSVRVNPDLTNTWLILQQHQHACFCLLHLLLTQQSAFGWQRRRFVSSRDPVAAEMLREAFSLTHRGSQHHLHILQSDPPPACASSHQHRFLLIPEGSVHVSIHESHTLALFRCKSYIVIQSLAFQTCLWTENKKNVIMHPETFCPFKADTSRSNNATWTLKL